MNGLQDRPTTIIPATPGYHLIWDDKDESGAFRSLIDSAAVIAWGLTWQGYPRWGITAVECHDDYDAVLQPDGCVLRGALKYPSLADYEKYAAKGLGTGSCRWKADLRKGGDQ